MSDWHELVSVVDACTELFLSEISEGEDKPLCLVLVEAKVSPETESLEILGKKIEGLHRLIADADSRVFELVWSNYIAYGVTNESFAVPQGTTAPDSGRLLRRYSKSAFLDYVAHSTWGDDEWPGPYTHIEIVAAAQIINVVSTELPNLNLLSPE